MSTFKEKLNNNQFVISAELFPPKGTDISILLKRAEYLKGVDAVNVTDNQRASMRLGSMAVCRMLKEKGYEPILQMTCRDRNRIALQSDLLSSYVLGIENVLILSGDHPQNGEYKGAKAVYDLDPVQLLSAARMLETGIDLAGKKLVGSPKFCLGAVANPNADPLDLQILMMGKKAQAGAEFFQTQPVFDIEKYTEFLNKTKHIPAKVLPGVALLKSSSFVQFLLGIPGITIPQDIIKRIESAPDQLKEGIKICAETIRELKKTSPGVHIMAIGMEEHIPEILSKI